MTVNSLTHTNVDVINKTKYTLSQVNRITNIVVDHITITIVQSLTVFFPVRFNDGEPFDLSIRVNISNTHLMQIFFSFVCVCAQNESNKISVAAYTMRPINEEKSSLKHSIYSGHYG